MGNQRRVIWGLGIVSLIAIVYSFRTSPKSETVTKAVDKPKTLVISDSFSDSADSPAAAKTSSIPSSSTGTLAETQASEAEGEDEYADSEAIPKLAEAIPKLGEARTDDALLTDEARETRLRELLATTGSDVSEAMEIHSVTCEDSSCKIEAESRTDDLGFFQESMVTFLRDHPGMGKNFEINTNPQNLRIATFVISKLD